MIGAIAGDIIGSVHEHAGTKTKHFPLFVPRCQFTDDTVLTIAVADALIAGKELISTIHDYFDRYPTAGYGESFFRWAALREREPYNSWGNGSAMRVSAIGFAMDTLEEVLREAERSAAITHSHEEGIRGAQATAAAIYLARTGNDKRSIKSYVESQFGYDLNRRLDDIRPGYTFDVSCQGSVPESIIAFLEGDDYEDTIRNAISLGGDADTMACIAGGIAEAFWGVPAEIEREALARLDDELLGVVQAFKAEFGSA